MAGGRVREAIRDRLKKWLRRQLNDVQFAWLENSLGELADGRERDLHVVMGLAPRRLGKADLKLSADDLASADAARSGWDPRHWTVDDAARILALLEYSAATDRFPETFMRLCRTAEVGEAIALYRGLPLYEWPEQLEWQAGEGLRTSMRAVFEAIAHRSPYPKEIFSEERWNQMVLKALFIGSSLSPIRGLDERRNPALARTLCDYAHERWAAGRPVTPELWRCVGPFAAGEMVGDLERLASSDDDQERRAAALALSISPDDQASEVLKRLPAEAMMVQAGTLSWDTLSA
jgi:hypothetical protein